MSERRLAWITREQRDFASRMDENIGPLFGRDIARAYDQAPNPAEADLLREALHSMVGDNFGWGDDTVDNWWKHHIRRVLGDTPDE
jgi:hypothetical protein